MFSRTIRVIVGFRLSVDEVVVPEVVMVVTVVCLALDMPSANFPASVNANVLEGSETKPVASKVPESSGNNVIPCAANSLTASPVK